MAGRREDVYAFCFSRDLSLDDITRRLGLKPDASGSHRVGDPRGAGAPFSGSLWRREAPGAGVASIDEQVESLSPVLDRLGEVDWPDGVMIGIEIAIYSSSPAPTVRLSPRLLQACAGRNLEIEVCVYYCDDDA